MISLTPWVSPFNNQPGHSVFSGWGLYSIEPFRPALFLPLGRKELRRKFFCQKGNLLRVLARSGSVAKDAGLTQKDPACTTYTIARIRLRDVCQGSFEVPDAALRLAKSSLGEV